MSAPHTPTGARRARRPAPPPQPAGWRPQQAPAGRSRLLVVGSANHDTILRVGAVPEEGETIVATDARSGMGGKGANQAMAAASLGRPTDLLAAIGDDGAGELVRQHLATARVGTGLLQTVLAPTGQAIVLLEPDGGNRIVVAPGANALLDVEAAAGGFEDAAAVLCQLEIPLDAVRTALHHARRQQALAVLNAAPAQPAAAELLPLVDVLVVNQPEAAQLAGATRPDQAAVALRAAGPSLVVVTLGAAGAVLAGPDGVVRQPAPVIPVVDTTGAGDCFTGAFVHALLAGDEPAQALRVGCAAGALAVTRAGAGVRLDRASLDALLGSTP